jgi:MFS family permease
VFSSPPRTWFYPNFGVLIGVSLLPYLWWTSFFNIFTLLWQQVYGWTAVSTAVHMYVFVNQAHECQFAHGFIVVRLPLGIIAFAVTLASGPLARKIDPKWLILFGQACTIVATILLAFASSPGRYWSFVFPAALIGSGGMQLIFTQIK